MNIKEMSFEELIDDHEQRFIGSGECLKTRNELLRRLEEGQKAIEKIKKLELLIPFEEDYSLFVFQITEILTEGKTCESCGEKEILEKDVYGDLLCAECFEIRINEGRYEKMD